MKRIAQNTIIKLAAGQSASQTRPTVSSGDPTFTLELGPEPRIFTLELGPAPPFCTLPRHIPIPKFGARTPPPPPRVQPLSQPPQAARSNSIMGGTTN